MRPVSVFATVRRWIGRFNSEGLDQLLQAFPHAPAIVVICDNDSIHHARKVTAYLARHPRLELLYGARYSPNDSPRLSGLATAGKRGKRPGQMLTCRADVDDGDPVTLSPRLQVLRNSLQIGRGYPP